MNKNLEELKKISKLRDVENNPTVMGYLIPFLEDFEKRLTKLELFLSQDSLNRMDSKDKSIKIYRVNPNIIRIDIKTAKG